MKRFFIIAFLALLVISGSMFAYTWTTATATIGVSAPSSDFATITVGGNITAPSPVFGKFTGTWPTSNLFTITPAAGYTGDLVIKVYLLNTGSLIRYYHHVNMQLILEDSAVSPAIVDDQGIVQCLNLENAEVQFYWSSGTGTTPLKVWLWDGSFRLHHWEVLSGGSVQPQLWCEVTQR